MHGPRPGRANTRTRAWAHHTHARKRRRALPSPARPPLAPQRLVAENLQQQQLIEQLVSRVDHVEEMMRAWQEEQRASSRRSAWGGFFGPRGLPDS